MKVLLVEDDPKVASHIANGLLGEGHECITVGDGTSGYQQASSNDLDAVILDVMLPELFCFRKTSRRRKHNPCFVIECKKPS